MRVHITILLVAMLAAGCASTEAGRTLAEDISSSTAAFEKQINAKIAAENTFYETQLAKLRAHLGGEFGYKQYVELPDDAARSKFISDLVKKTLLYGRIRFGAQREAEVAAARILDGNASPTIEMITATDTGITEDLKYAHDVRARQLALKIERITGLAKLEYAKDDLATVRRRLASISASPTAEEEAKAWMNFGQALRDELNKKKE